MNLPFLRMVWSVIVALMVLAPFISLIATKSLSWLGALVFLGGPLLITLIAWSLGTTPLAYWSVPVAAALPWAVTLAAIFLWAHCLPKGQQDAAIMSGLFPLFGLAGAVGVSIIVAFFLPADLPLPPRILWPMAFSGGVALMLLLVILAALFSPSASASPSGKNSAPPNDSGITSATEQPHTNDQGSVQKPS